MKMSTQKYKNLYSNSLSTALFTVFVCFYCQKSLAIIGYEETTNKMIDTTFSIYDINIADDFQYYDFEDRQYKNGYVEFKDYTAAGLRLETKEIETSKPRIFIIDYN